MNPITDEMLNKGAYKDEYAQLYRGHVKENGKVADPYSPNQRAIVQKMTNYLRTGK